MCTVIVIVRFSSVSAFQIIRVENCERFFLLLLVAELVSILAMESQSQAPEEQTSRSSLTPASSAGRRKKWVARPLVTKCGVCDSPATDVQHHGSVSCYSCR